MAACAGSEEPGATFAIPRMLDALRCREQAWKTEAKMSLLVIEIGILIRGDMLMAYALSVAHALSDA